MHEDSRARTDRFTGRAAMPPALQELMPRIDEQGVPATALLGSFRPGDGTDPRRVFALVDRCLSSWIEHLAELDLGEVDLLDKSWLRVRMQRQQLLDRLVCLRSHLRADERLHGTPQRLCND